MSTRFEKKIPASRRGHLHIRLHEHEEEELKRRAKAAGKTVSDYVRDRALGKTMRPTKTQENNSLRNT